MCRVRNEALAVDTFSIYTSGVPFDWDETKRGATLATRGLDFADAPIVLDGVCVTFEDARRDYGEPRFITLGELVGRVVVVAWTQRNDVVRIISMRKANDREKRLYRERLVQG